MTEEGFCSLVVGIDREEEHWRSTSIGGRRRSAVEEPSSWRPKLSHANRTETRREKTRMETRTGYHLQKLEIAHGSVRSRGKLRPFSSSDAPAIGWKRSFVLLLEAAPFLAGEMRFLRLGSAWRRRMPGMRKASRSPAALIVSGSAVWGRPSPCPSWKPSSLSTVCFYSTEVQPQLSTGIIKIMEQRMVAIEKRSAYLHELINQPEAMPTEYSKANKELQQLENSIGLIKDLRAKQKEIDGLKSLLAECSEDKDMRDMITEEMSETLDEEKRLQHRLLRSLLPKDDADERDCILEVRAGTGGEEASLFAMDVFRMYEKFSQKKGWKFDVVEIMVSNLKGYKVRGPHFNVLCLLLSRKLVQQFLELVHMVN